MADSLRAGVQNLLLGAGMGGMRPNTLLLERFTGSHLTLDDYIELLQVWCVCVWNALRVACARLFARACASPPPKKKGISD